MHPETTAALESARTFIYAVDELEEEVDRIRARRPSATSRVIPEVDAMGRLTDLYIAPGTLAVFKDPRSLVTEIMGAITESTLDAERQHHALLDRTRFPGPPFAGSNPVPDGGRP
ncbi:hypothetical protein ACWCPQ_06190 [Nocardia sp. NPDC001965]